MVGKPSTCTEQERRSSVSARDNRRALTLRSSFLFYLDVSLRVLFILCLSLRLTGLPWHEMLGLAFIRPLLLPPLFPCTWLWWAGKAVLVFMMWGDYLRLVV